MQAICKTSDSATMPAWSGRFHAMSNAATITCGTAITTLSIATSEGWKDKNTGQQQERTDTDPATWERVAVDRALPTATRFLVVHIRVNRTKPEPTATPVTFAGSFVDDVKADLRLRPAPVAPAAKPTAALIWTPRATKLLQEAGIDPATVTAIEATGPGGRVSGDDVVRYLAARKA